MHKVEVKLYRYWKIVRLALKNSNMFTLKINKRTKNGKKNGRSKFMKF